VQRDNQPLPATRDPNLRKGNDMTFSPDAAVFMAAATLDDLERTRIAAENRLRQFTRIDPDEDGVIRGFGLDERHPDVAQLAALVDALKALEHQGTLQIQRAVRKHPLGPWVKATIGVGEKQAARLLASIGDPYWNTLHDRPRTVSELWAYCGLHVIPGGHWSGDTHGLIAAGDSTSTGGDAHVSREALPGFGVAARRRKGVKANWSADAKMRAYLIATSCIKQASSPYRDVYDKRREHTAVTHPDWTPGHSHNDALRIVSKEVLKDLWRESARLHALTETTELEIAA
jgi:hypothetical protein